MMEDKKDGKQGSKLYNLTQLRGKEQIGQYTSLITMLNSQIVLYKKAIDKLNVALSLYHNTVDNLAQFVDISPLQGQTKDEDVQQLKAWLFSVEELIINTIKQRPKQIQTIVQVQKLVSVETPIYIEKIVQVDRPITIIQEVEREVQKHIYIEKIVQMPIFVEKNQKRMCVKCSGRV